MFKVIGHQQVLQFTMGLPGCSGATFHAYLIDGLLIDTGPARFGRRMIAACRGQRTEQIVNTSGSACSIGNNALLQREFSLPVRAHRQALPLIRQPRANLELTLWQRLCWGWPKPAKARRINSWIRTSGHGFRVIPVPEGRWGEICLFEEEKGWLFSGNLLAGGLSARAESLLGHLNVDRIFCARHGVITDINMLKEQPHCLPESPAAPRLSRQHWAG